MILVDSCFSHFLFARCAGRLQILQILVRAVVENLSDSRGDGAHSLHSKVKELFGRVTSRHGSDAEIWRQYAKLYGGGRSDELEDDDKVSVWPLEGGGLTTGALFFLFHSEQYLERTLEGAERQESR